MLQSLALVGFMAVSSVLAVKCGDGQKCPESAPCCGQFGDCGIGAFCLGGCDPRNSFKTEACLPAPVCKDKKMKLDSLKNVMDISDYLGDAEKADWVSQGEPTPHNDAVLLTMARQSVGTVLSSTEYMWYGNVKARMKSSRGRGVVTAFILFSDVQDEIDYEWVGVDLETVQTNFYWHGVTNYENSGNISLSDTFRNYHDYEIRWTPDKIEFLVDGQKGREVNRKDTFNKTSNQFEFPQTPSRVQLSLWPGGLESNAQGTIDWAGGEIDWNHDDIQNAGYFYAAVESVEIECYNADSGPGTNNGKSYYYEGDSFTNETVVDGDKNTTIGSLMATGLDPDKGKKEDKSSSASSSSASKSSDDDDAEETQAASVPGGGNGSAGQDHSDDGDDGDDGDSGGSGSGGSNGGGGGGGGVEPADVEGCDTSSFNQNCGSNDGADSDESNDEGSASRHGASALAVIIAACALFWL